MSYIHFFGIDVSKDWFDVSLYGAEGSKPSRFLNKSEGFEAFQRAYGSFFPQAFVVLEATGGYENDLIAFLVSHKLALHRADPSASSHFLRSLRVRGKTDQLDAQGLARYGAERHSSLRLFHLESQAQRELKALAARRQDLVQMHMMEQQRLQHPNYVCLKEEVLAHLAFLSQSLEVLEARMQALIKASLDLKAKQKILLQEKGVGPKTTLMLLAFMPELGHITRRQAASLAGLAPHPYISGSSRKAPGRTGGGRHVIKQALFMAAFSASRFNPVLKDFYKRLIEQGKKPIVALIALMRKLITRLNAQVRDAAIPQQGR